MCRLACLGRGLPRASCLGRMGASGDDLLVSHHKGRFPRVQATEPSSSAITCLHLEPRATHHADSTIIKPDLFCGNLRLDHVGAFRGNVARSCGCRWEVRTGSSSSRRSCCWAPSSPARVVLIVRRVEERDGAYAPVLMSTLAVMFLPCAAWLIGPAADIVAYPLLLGLFFADIGADSISHRGKQLQPVGLSG